MRQNWVSRSLTPTSHLLRTRKTQGTFLKMLLKTLCACLRAAGRTQIFLKRMTSRFYSMQTWTTKRSLRSSSMRMKRERKGRMEAKRKLMRNRTHCCLISTPFAKITHFCCSLQNNRSLKFSQMKSFCYCFKCLRSRATQACVSVTILWALTALSTTYISIYLTLKLSSMRRPTCSRSNKPTKPFSSSQT